MQTTTPEQLLGLLNETEQKNAPDELFIEGNPRLLHFGARVSLVGSRKASKAGLDRTRKLAIALTSENVVIVSGLALGIDKAAHLGAIESGGRTVAVIGTPLDKYYPAEHRSLQDLIATEHLLISQFPKGSRTFPSCFPMRNRTMALISDATIIVEAQDNSGSLHQGWEALRLGRPLFICKEVLNDCSLNWPEQLMKYGAIPISTNSNGIDSILEHLPVRCSGSQDTHAELPC